MMTDPGSLGGNSAGRELDFPPVVVARFLDISLTTSTLANAEFWGVENLFGGVELFPGTRHPIKSGLQIVDVERFLDKYLSTSTCMLQ